MNKNKKLAVKSAVLVRLDFELLNHKSKVGQSVKRLDLQCEIVNRREQQIKKLIIFD